MGAERGILLGFSFVLFHTNTKWYTGFGVVFILVSVARNQVYCTRSHAVAVFAVSAYQAVFCFAWMVTYAVTN